MRAKDIMSNEVVTLSPDDSVKEAAKKLVENHISSAPVLNSEGRLVGVVTDSDLIIQDVKIQFPSYIHLLDSFIFLGSEKKFEHLLKKAAAAKVKDLMTTNPVFVAPNTEVEDLATLMTERKIGCLPVLDDKDELVGVITKSDIVRAIAGI
jgi:CBS domain-containing protein